MFLLVSWRFNFRQSLPPTLKTETTKKGSARELMDPMTHGPTVIRSLIPSNLASPMVGTSMMSSIFSKGPLASRWSMIFWAVDGPMPGSACSAAAVAVLMLTGPPAADPPSASPPESGGGGLDSIRIKLRGALDTRC